MVSPCTKIDANILHEPKNKPGTNTFRRLLNIFSCSYSDPAVHSIDTHEALEEHAAPEADREDEEYSDDGEPDEEHKDDRRNFKAIRSITRNTLEDLVMEDLYPIEEVNTRTCRVTHRKEGSFHHCVFLDVHLDGQLEQQYVLKIPAHGTSGEWQSGDAFMMRHEAMLMQYIHRHTKCPVPEVMDFDETLDNAIGAPYILMKKMPGIPALDFWFGKTIKDLAQGEAYLEADDPSPELDRKRSRFLVSLAQAMSQLQALEFKQIGVPTFEESDDELPDGYGPVYRWHSKAYMQEVQAIGPYSTAGKFFDDGLNTAWDVAEILPLDPGSFGVQEFLGIRKIMATVLTCPPFALLNSLTANDGRKKVSKKKFVLRHDDLNLQNILVDDQGNVAGIIDWDGCHSVPRCVGYASLPLFLRGDWLENNTMAKCPYMTWGFDHYRSIYADAMGEACRADDGSLSDAQYTRKSAMYQALLAVFNEGEDCRQVVGKLLAEIEEFRHVDLKQFCARLGKGWPAAEKVLKEKLAELLAPEVLI